MKNLTRSCRPTAQ